MAQRDPRKRRLKSNTNLARRLLAKEAADTLEHTVLLGIVWVVFAWNL